MPTTPLSPKVRNAQAKQVRKLRAHDKMNRVRSNFKKACDNIAKKEALALKEHVTAQEKAASRVKQLRRQEATEREALERAREEHAKRLKADREEYERNNPPRVVTSSKPTSTPTL